MKSLISVLFLPTLVYSAVAAQESPPQQPLGLFDDEASAGGLPFSTSALEEYIEGAMEKWHAPGMAVAIINGNKTWAKVSFSHVHCQKSFPPPPPRPAPTSQEQLVRTNLFTSQPRASATPPSPQHQ